ncbi:hypothetical protein VTO42DRAFT_1500 [Malbranchea cinnamomea]
MNNEQFRRLLFDNPAPIKKASPENDASAAGKATPLSAPRALGSKARSSIPMTPRAVTSVNFARQLAEYRRESQQPPPSKKVKPSAAPKGMKLAPGYTDRALLRKLVEDYEERGGTGADEREIRTRALEEAVKLGHIDRGTFERLREDIELADVGSAKGLNWQLLRKVKGGGDAEQQQQQQPENEESAKQDGEALGGEGSDVVGEGAEDEFERVIEEKEKEEVKPVQQEAKVKKGVLAPASAAAATGARKMTRDEILRQLKESRAAAREGSQDRPQEEGPASTLGSKFKKIGENKKRWIETDEHGRRKEVLQITDAEGRTKRKVRWLDKPVQQENAANGGLPPSNKGSEPLGMEVPADVLARMKKAAEEEKEDEDIFQGVGDDYNPLAGIDDGSSTSESEEEGETKEKQEAVSKQATEGKEAPAQPPTRPRDYFSTGTATTKASEDATESKERANPLTSDPTILAALKRAAEIQKKRSPSPDADDIDADEEANLRRKKFLEEARRREMMDSMDIDMGFGESRFADDDDEEDWEERKAGNKRKRGPKKKKLNKESASDVMRVLEGRRKADDKS